MEDVLTLADPEAVADAIAEIFVATAQAAVETHGRFIVGLSGDRAALGAYSVLAEPQHAERIPWDRTVVLFSDDRCGPADHPECNYRKVRDILLDRLPSPGPRVERMQGEIPHAGRAAHFYEEVLRELFPDAPLPRLDLVLLGIEADGHVASLLAGTDALKEETRWCVANYLAHWGVWRLTLTLPILRAARLTLFLGSGAECARVVAEAFCGMPHDTPHPCELVAPQGGSRQVLLDHEAASMVPVGSHRR